jgi:L-2-hydroxyglutarate oxidase LhgO
MLGLCPFRECSFNSGHLPGLTHLFGIESPGLTASLSLAEDVVGYLSS